MVKVRPHGVSDQATARALDDLAANAIGPGLLTDAVLMENISLAANTVVRVKHNLGRRAKGYVITGRRAVVISDVVRLVSSVDMYPYIEATNWDPPGGSQDYWTTLKTGRSLQIPMPLAVGETLKRIDLTLYAAGATDLTIDTYKATTADASASSISPVVTWNALATTTWQKVFATFSEVAAADYHYYMRLVGTAIGDRVRMAQFTVTPTTAPVVYDLNDQHNDLDKFIYLKSVGGSMTVDVAVF